MTSNITKAFKQKAKMGLRHMESGGVITGALSNAIGEEQKRLNQQAQQTALISGAKDWQNAKAAPVGVDTAMSLNNGLHGAQYTFGLESKNGQGAQYQFEQSNAEKTLSNPVYRAGSVNDPRATGTVGTVGTVGTAGPRGGVGGAAPRHSPAPNLMTIDPTRRGLKEGGIVQDFTGKGSPDKDTVPAMLADGEAVLPAKTVLAMGGPQAVEHLIETTNGKPSATAQQKGLRGGVLHAEDGAGTIFVDRNGNARINPNTNLPATQQPVYESAGPERVINPEPTDPRANGERVINERPTAAEGRPGAGKPIGQMTPNDLKRAAGQFVADKWGSVKGLAKEAGKGALQNFNTIANGIVAAGDVTAADHANGQTTLLDVPKAFGLTLAGAAGMDLSRDNIETIKRGMAPVEAAGNAVSGFLADRLPTGWVSGLGIGLANGATNNRPVTAITQKIHGDSPITSMYRENYGISKDKMPGVFETAGNAVAAMSSDGKTTVMAAKEKKKAADEQKTQAESAAEAVKKAAPKPEAPKTQAQVAEDARADLVNRQEDARKLEQFGDKMLRDRGLSRAQGLLNDEGVRNTFNAAHDARGDGVRISTATGADGKNQVLYTDVGAAPRKGQYIGANGEVTDDWTKTSQYAQAIKQAEKDKVSLRNLQYENALSSLKSSNPAWQQQGLLTLKGLEARDKANADLMQASAKSNGLDLAKFMYDMQKDQRDYEARRGDKAYEEHNKMLDEWSMRPMGKDGKQEIDHEYRKILDGVIQRNLKGRLTTDNLRANSAKLRDMADVQFKMMQLAKDRGLMQQGLDFLSGNKPEITEHATDVGLRKGRFTLHDIAHAGLLPAMLGQQVVDYGGSTRPLHSIVGTDGGAYNREQALEVLRRENPNYKMGN